jgi:indolepyruvate ferredoxin oxidoreductase
LAQETTGTTDLYPGTVIRDRYLLGDGVVPMTGVQALARLAFDLRRADDRAGRRTAGFISGYEGSPLGGYDLELQRQQALLDELDIVFRPGVNEELAATAVQGTQLAAASPDARVSGVFGLWYGKSPGLDRATDALRHGNLMGTHPRGGAVAAVGDDPAAKSSTVPGASEFLLADLGMPVLYPADPQDVLDLGVHAIAMSRASGLWSALKIVTGVADGTSNVRVAPDRVVPAAVTGPGGQPYAHEVTAVMLQPHLSRLERSREGIRRDMAIQYAQVNRLNRILEPGSGGPGASGRGVTARIGIAAAGRTYLDLRHALARLGLDDAELGRRGVRLLRLAMIHPLIPAEVTRFADGLDEIIVVEEKRAFLESALRAELYGHSGAPRITGKRDAAGQPLFGTDGVLTVDAIADGLARRLSAIGGFPSLAEGRPGQAGAGRGSASLTRPRSPLPIAAVSSPRTPYFCSGCPHNSSTKVPGGSLVGAGIGCHALVLLVGSEDVGEVTGLTQMGGEGAQWNGMAPFLNRTHLLQNLGDGTFHHSGSLAIRAAVASGVNITYKILYNSAVAMTGGQEPAGGMSVAAMARTLLAEGVARIIVTTEDPGRYRRLGLPPGRGLPRGVRVWPRERLVEAQETLAATKGVTVLIHDQECATELRRKRKRGLAPVPRERVVINERICEGCGDCGHKSNCLSVQPVETEFGRKTRIDQSSCNVDLSCLAGDCPSFMTVRLPDQAAGRGGAASGRGTAPTGGGAAGGALAALGGDLPEPARRAGPAARPHATRIAGIGGTGVVTVSQILSAAATFAGLDVAALDQTGLAQKGGAVISDVIIGGPAGQGNGLAAGECDLYLGCDLLVAAEEANLTVADPGRTVAVVSTDVVPTGAMVTDARSPAPDIGALTQRIAAAAQGGDAVFIGARRISSALFGADHFANIFLLGCAYQGGNLPLPAAAIESAITANGVAVPANLEAFRRGRQAVCDPDGLAAALRGRDPGRPAAASANTAVPDAPAPAGVAEAVTLIGAPAGSGLDRLAASRVRELAAYQDIGYARRYAETVARVYQREQDVRPGQTELSETVARYLYKLMAYKDEYEVARLALSPAGEAAVREQFGPGARISYRLHPPVLRALGMKRKVSLGPWFKPAFTVLRSMRRLRGTRLDPFGYTGVRRTERALIGEYLETVELILGALNEGSYKDCVELAALPDEIRGYEGIKLASVGRYRESLAELSAALGS